MGKLTVVHKGKSAGGATANTYALPGFTPDKRMRGTSSAEWAPSNASASTHPPVASTDLGMPPPAHQVQAVSVIKSAPQKKSGIVRQNREILRDRVLHILAHGPVDELELVERLKSPSSALQETLSTLARKIDGSWSLLPEQFKYVQIESWPQYDARSRETVVENALAAFDLLGLPADSSERLQVLQIQKRMANVAATPAPSSNASASLTPMKSQSNATSTNLPTSTPIPKKKHVRAVIAPTLANRLKPDASKGARRSLVVPATASSILAASADTVAGAAADGGGSAHVIPLADTSTRGPPRSAGRPSLPVQSAVQTLKGSHIEDSGDLHRAVPESAGPWSQAGKSSNEQRRQPIVSSSAPATAIVESSDGHHLPQNRTSGDHSRRSRPRGMSDSNQPASRIDAESRQPQWPVEANRYDRSRSRSNSRNQNASPFGAIAAAVEGAHAGRDKKLQHVPVRSRPLKAEDIDFPLAAHPARKTSAETAVAVSRIQEKLAHGMTEARVSGGTSFRQVDANVGALANEREALNASRHWRGPSLSPMDDLGEQRSPSPVPKVKRVETLSELKQLQEQLTTAYTEYSQLRVKIDAYSAEFAPLAAKLDDARAACSKSVRRALDERKTSEVDREEGEEVPGDAPIELAMATDPTTEKCTSDGSRLYWAETSSGTGWLADSADAVVVEPGIKVASQPSRVRSLLSEESCVLRVSQEIIGRYEEMGASDVRRSVKRYLHLHALVEQMGLEVSQAHERISNALFSQFDALRDDLGDDMVDAEIDAVEDLCTSSDFVSRKLTIDAYRPDLAGTEGDAVPTV
ncbi:hypothetical protein H4R26_004678 [Coemansia thaxteri]|uniref:RNA polymerase II elongation factor ELL N-terminal domain-containing protein n=1 Tax=Coemansia thaxteri TaxID=2663907 RepID=A0A9W8BFQ1_9FUNG|nr:hypothetical protein H4R26_004678 [Coemansia thaxteri]